MKEFVMRKTDLQVGEEYAFGSTSAYDRWRMSRCRIVDLDGELKVAARGWGREGEVLSKGIVIEILPGGEKHPYLSGIGFRESVSDKSRGVLDSARSISRPWAEYAEAKCREDEAIEEGQARIDRIAGRLAERGIACRKLTTHTFTIELTMDAAESLLGMLDTAEG